jgi:hypothetical protein
VGKQASRSSTDTLLRNLAAYAKNEHVRLNAIRMLLELEGRQGESKSIKKRVQTGGLTDLLDSGELRDQSDQTSGN